MAMPRRRALPCLPMVRLSVILSLTLTACRTLSPDRSQTAGAEDQAPGPDRISVDTSKVIRSLVPSPLGINVNFLRDDDRNRPKAKPLKDALLDLKVRVLRYPGGEKSDFQLWSQAPWQSAKPQLYGWYKDAARNVMDFDQFTKLVAATGTVPYIVVGYDTQPRTGITYAAYLDAAVNWVRYANVTKHLGIKYWEIGNENWHNGTAKPAELAMIVHEFSQAMKAVDPTIKVGTSGDANDDSWWQGFLPTGAADVDFIVVSNYPSVDSLATYTSDSGATLNRVKIARRGLDAYAPQVDKNRIRIVVAEYNAVDWFKKWPDSNDVAHALVACDMFGEMISEPAVELGMFWGTHWLDDSEAYKSVFYALNKDNLPTPQGLSVKIWGDTMGEQLVAATSTSPGTKVYAMTTPSQHQATAMMINKTDKAASSLVTFQNCEDQLTHGDVWQFAGNGATDLAPTWQKIATVTLVDNSLELQLPPYSVTVVVAAADEPLPTPEVGHL